MDNINQSCPQMSRGKNNFLAKYLIDFEGRKFYYEN